MKIFFDTEFIEDGKTIELISIGMVRQHGGTLYCESSEVDLSLANPWVKENVLPHLTGETMPRAEIAEKIKDFVGEDPEFWAYYADYDWVALCQLYGTMIQIPEGWPMYCKDLKQYCDSLGNPTLPEQKTTEHNAVDDAIWNFESWLYLHSGQYRQ